MEGGFYFILFVAFRTCPPPSQLLLCMYIDVILFFYFLIRGSAAGGRAGRGSSSSICMYLRGHYYHVAYPEKRSHKLARALQSVDNK